MNKTALLAIVVAYRLTFLPFPVTKHTEPQVYERRIIFNHEDEARWIKKGPPKGKYECFTGYPGASGLCEVEILEIKEMKK